MTPGRLVLSAHDGPSDREHLVERQPRLLEFLWGVRSASHNVAMACFDEQVRAEDDGDPIVRSVEL